MKNFEIFSAKIAAEFAKIKNLDELENFEKNFFGKNSELKKFLAELKNLSVDEKKIWGPKIQNLKKDFLEKIADLKKKLLQKNLDEKLRREFFDVTKNLPHERGAVHPIFQIQKKCEKIFSSMGFEIADGPEVDTEWNNFDALNVPASHPARDMQDTFWINSKNSDPHKNSVLRTQTSNLQIRKMLEKGAPIKIIAPGKVFRNESVDASHGAIFWQIEGLLVDEKISLANLKGVFEKFLSEIFEKKIKIRLRPGYFPFVEPGLEVDFSCAICDGRGCKTCKNSGWIEFSGAGMVHPQVLRNCKIDPQKFSGFAFGFGLSRLAMMKFRIPDHRFFFENKKEFLEQF